VTRALLFRPQARAELLEARAWYDAERPGLGTAFLTEIRSAVSLLRQMPQAFPVVHPPIRRLLLKRFPYALYFFLDEEAVVVTALVHGRRDPEVWRSR
jgi:plasmid stabilization system protein ParE